MKTWKKILIATISIIVLIRVGYICIGGEVVKEQYSSRAMDLTQTTKTLCEDIVQTFCSVQTRLYSISIMLSDVQKEQDGYLILKIEKGEELLYQTNISMEHINAEEWYMVYVNMPIDVGQEYCLTLDASGNCTDIPNVLVVENDKAAEEAFKSFKDGKEINGQFVFAYGYQDFPGRIDRMASSMIWLIFLFAVVLLILYFEKIIEQIVVFFEFLFLRIKKEVFFPCAEIMLCFTIINTSGIIFQASTEILFYAISLMASINLERKYNFVSKFLDKVWEKILILLSVFYAAFALVGQRILIYPLDRRVTAAGVMVLVLTMLWFVPIILTMLYGSNKLGKVLIYEAVPSKSKKDILSMFVATLICLLLPAFFNLIANNPGISSPDTLGTIENARNLRGAYDFHPVFYSILLRAVLNVWDSTYAIIFVQYLFWAYIMIEFLFYLGKKGFKNGVITAIALFSGINAGNFLHLNTIWKDVPYALSLFWCFVILAKLVLDYEEYKKKWFIHLELALSLVLIGLCRKNGIVVVVIVAAACLLLLRKNMKVYAALLLTLIVIGMVKYPIYSYLEVESSGKSGMYIGLGQDILGVYCAGGEVSEDTLQMINIMTKYNNAGYNYVPTWAFQSYDLDVEVAEFVRNYLDTFVRNPVLMIRAVIARQDAVWNIFMGEGCILKAVDYHETMDGQSNWNEYYPTRVYTSLYTGMAAATKYTVDNQWINAIEWRCGVWTLIGVIATMAVMLKVGCGKWIIIMSPVIGQILSLILSTGWSDYRYFWPLNLLNLGVLFVVIMILHDSEESSGGK